MFCKEREIICGLAAVVHAARSGSPQVVPECGFFGTLMSVLRLDLAKIVSIQRKEVRIRECGSSVKQLETSKARCLYSQVPGRGVFVKGFM